MDEDQNLTADEAVALLGVPEKNEDTAPDTSDPEKRDAEDGQAEPDGKAPAEEPQPEPESDEDDKEGEQEDEETEAEEPEKELAEIEYDGKSYKVDPELKDAVLRYSDYTRKTQELAAEKENFLGQVKGLANEYANAINIAADYAKHFAAADDLKQQLEQAARAGDQLLILQIKDAIRERQDQTKAIFAEQERLTQAERAKERAELTQYRQKQEDILAKELPGWSEGRVQAGLTDYFHNQGYTAEELKYLLDARVVKAFHKAMKYDALQAKKPEIATKLQPKVQSLKPAKHKGGVAQATAIRKRFEATGSLDDAAELMHLLG